MKKEYIYCLKEGMFKMGFKLQRKGRNVQYINIQIRDFFFKEEWQYEERLKKVEEVCLGKYGSRGCA